jgi:anti-sigma B factor antagonist
MTLVVQTTITETNAAVAVCSGDVDVSSCPKLIDAFASIALRDVDRIIVDMREVTFIDSTGVGCLLHGAIAARSRGTPFRLILSGATRNFIVSAGLGAQLDYLTLERPTDDDEECRPRGACALLKDGHTSQPNGLPAVGQNLPLLIDREQLAHKLEVRLGEVVAHSQQHGFPRPVAYFRGRMLWDLTAVEAWLLGERVQSAGTNPDRGA